jgi:serine/threonine protein kinase
MSLSQAQSSNPQMANKDTRIIAILRQAPRSGKVFARKVIRVQSTLEDVEYEVAIPESLLKRRHENIIEILNHGWLETARKIYFIDMELAEFSLADYIDYVFGKKMIPTRLRPVDRAAIDLARNRVASVRHLFATWAIGSQIAAGLAFLHGANVVHRNLRPQNILYCTGSQSQVWKLTDFAFSAAKMSLLLPERGTSGYNAPELLADGRFSTSRSDIWALGCILYELATGRRLFQNVFAIVAAYYHTNHDEPLMRDISFGDNAWERQFIESQEHLLSKSPEGRPTAPNVYLTLSAYCDVLEIWAIDTVQTEADNQCLVDSLPASMRRFEHIGSTDDVKRATGAIKEALNIAVPEERRIRAPGLLGSFRTVLQALSGRRFQETGSMASEERKSFDASTKPLSSVKQMFEAVDFEGNPRSPEIVTPPAISTFNETQHVTTRLSINRPNSIATPGLYQLLWENCNSFYSWLGALPKPAFALGLDILPDDIPLYSPNTAEHFSGTSPLPPKAKDLFRNA